jgi:hypothetical protein
MKLVEAISVFRIRYVIDTDSEEWAADTVTMEEATEVGQKHLEEVIVSIREIDKEEYLRIFDEDNEYVTDIDDERKLSRITKI